MQILRPRLFSLPLGLQVLGPHPLPPPPPPRPTLFLIFTYNIASVSPPLFSLLFSLHGDHPSSKEDNSMLVALHSFQSLIAIVAVFIIFPSSVEKACTHHHHPNMMASPNPSSRALSLESSYTSGANTMNPNMRPPHAPNQQSRALNEPVAILWDIENCPVPSDVRPEDVAGNIRMALRVHPVIKGAVTMFSAYGDFNAFPRRLREGCQRTGVKLIDVPNGRKDAADKAILIDMFLFALDNHPPSSILLISGDVDFAPALHILGQRGYTIILVIPAGVGVSSALSNAGRFVWDWPSVARGEGFVPPKAVMSRGPGITRYLMGCHLGENPDAQNEAIVYRGISQNESSTDANINQMYSFSSSLVSRDSSRMPNSFSDYRSNLIGASYFPASICQSLPSTSNEVLTGAFAGNVSETQEETLWVQPGDFQGLKGQLVRLLELAGGSLPLVRVPADYIKIYGRPLYVAEYGEFKLVNLLKKMADSLTVEGSGNRRFVCLRNFLLRPESVGPSARWGTGSKNNKEIQEENMDVVANVDMVGSSDDFSDDERVIGQDERNTETDSGPAHEFNKQIERFKQELQELLVSYSCKILLSSFEALYEQRYKKSLDYNSFRVDELEELIEKVRDVVILHEEQGSGRKFLVANCFNG
ncbi:NYN domain-containing protein [Cinnamomum micranthum f. kanehirae]|uniref:NYN domain-containing protein n=1 Tax=Cinnamomum micranthum f. kanehirae TaxID=337451 RepID=A0A3S3Q245_9MAGN|nr:NYN domain-containing protein [Cinnamomum micranthum f. kanehirae]